MRRLVDEANGYYSYWETGRRASLRELLINEGLAVQTSRAISPGHAAWEYFGYGRRQYARIRELEPVIARAAADDLDRAGLGLRLRYLSGGMSDEARTIERYVMPERSGYYLGARMTDAAFPPKEPSGPSAQVRQRSRPSPKPLPRLHNAEARSPALAPAIDPRASLLPNTERREYTTQDVFGVDGTDESHRAHRLPPGCVPPLWRWECPVVPLLAKFGQFISSLLIAIRCRARGQGRSRYWDSPITVHRAFDVHVKQALEVPSVA